MHQILHAKILLLLILSVFTFSSYGNSGDNCADEFSSEKVQIATVQRHLRQLDASQIQSTFLSAEQGDAEAQTLLGIMYYMSEGGIVQQDYIQAARWFTKAGKQGVANAQTFLGIMYLKGEGVQQNYLKHFIGLRKRWIKRMQMLKLF